MTDVNDLLRYALDSISDGFFILDDHWRFIYINRAARDAVAAGIGASDVDGKILWEAASHLVGTPFEQHCLRAMQEQQVAHFETQGTRDSRWYMVHVYPAPDAVSIAIVDITEDRQRTDRQQFLSDASKLLTGTLDFHETLRRLAYLAVPRIADWCAVYMENREGTLEAMEVVHVDPQKVSTVRDMYRRFPADPELSAVYAAYRSGETQWRREITDELLQTNLPDPEHRSIIQSLGLRSILIVPLIARGVRLGVMVFIYAESGRLYDERDVAFAEELAGRAAVAADNARLFEAAQRARRDAERREREEAALRLATEAVAATFSVQDIIEQIAQSALHATSADGSFVERVQPDSETVVVVAAAGDMSPKVGDTIPFEGSVAEYVLESKQPEIIQVLGQTRHRLPGTLAETYATSTALAVPLIDAGEAIGALILLRQQRDIPFTRDEAARAHTFGNLASLAFRKVHLLESSELRSRELEQVMESRTRLVRGFSHDLKNPLGAADGHAALLQDGMLGELTEQQRNSIERIRAALATAVALINDLVELARAEAGQIVIKTQPIDVREIVRELVEQYRPAAEQAGLSITGELASVDVVSNDADRLRQVLGNLLSNAVKYTKTGGSITVRTRMQAVPRAGIRAARKQMVSIEVVDTGIGIPQEKLGVLFTEFERIDPSVRPGAGLGLAISRRIARLLGGDVTVETQRGAGSTFTLWVADREVPETK
ncbi:MAG TPA: ATP-binding protein [Longimicrobiales bacterium]